MTKTLNKLLHEPLIHFLLLGFLLYLYYNQAISQGEEKINQVFLSSTEVEKIKRVYKEENSVEISKEQLSLEKKSKLYEKVLLHEAYRLKLDKEDSEIQKRLLKQMEFILDNTEIFTEPREKELYKYYKENIVDYSHLESLSFYYLPFTEANKASLAQTQKLIRHLDVKTIQGYKSIVDIDVKDVKEEFGKYFFHKMQNQKLFSWSELINSKKGKIIFYIVDKSVSYPYEFEEVEQNVYEDYIKELKKKKKLEAYRALSKRYILE